MSDTLCHTGVLSENTPLLTLMQPEPPVTSHLFDKIYYSCYDWNNCGFGAERNLEEQLKYAF